MIFSGYKADLHMHSTCSDGKFTPAELVHRAKNYGLSCISITDHDTTDGLDEALSTGDLIGIEVIPGVEITTTFNGREAHVLCYGFNNRDHDWKAMLASQQKIRRNRAILILEKLNEMGVTIDLDQVEIDDRADVITRPHIAQALVKSGHAQHTQDAFIRFIGNTAPAYVPLEHVKTEDLIEIVHAAGGIAILAHPGTHYSTEELQQLIDADIDGFECVHPSHGFTIQSKYRELAKTHGLIATSGSDFHGWRFQDFSYYGQITTDLETVNQLKARCRTRKSAFVAIES